MTRLADVVDLDALDVMLTQRFVKRQHHPEGGLVIYNYTAATQFERVWNEVTLSCRGLICDTDGNIVARPFKKFFNYGEHPDLALPDGEVHVTDKLDGSLGILYPLAGGYAVATRGSFISDQALHGTTVWRDRYAGRFTPNPEWTYLFEIIYPGNRIVVDYEGLDDLVLLGAVDIATGRSVPLGQAREGWEGPVVGEFPFTSLTEALTAPTRPGVEGLVVHFVEADVRVKLKQDDYLRLHRLVTDVSERRVWEMLSSGSDLGPWLESVPDEFATFVTDCRDRLLREHAELIEQVHLRYEAAVTSLPEGWARRDFAAAVTAMQWPLARALFLILDGKSFDHLVWNQLRPAEHTPLFARTEDAN